MGFWNHWEMRSKKPLTNREEAEERFEALVEIVQKEAAIRGLHFIMIVHPKPEILPSEKPMVFSHGEGLDPYEALDMLRAIVRVTETQLQVEGN